MFVYITLVHVSLALRGGNNDQPEQGSRFPTE
jgi:hypothetical protein